MAKEHILTWQRHLLSKGYEIATDGEFGPATLRQSIRCCNGEIGGNGNNTKRVSPKGIALIHSFESCKLTAYPDPGSADGNPITIGWGRAGPDIKRGTVWTQKQADDRFTADLGKFEKAVSLAAPVTTQNQFDALVSLAYNIGEGALSKSTLLKLHNAGDYVGAKAQFGKWINNAGRPMKGLIRRRAAEAELYGS